MKKLLLLLVFTLIISNQPLETVEAIESLHPNLEEIPNTTQRYCLEYEIAFGDYRLYYGGYEYSSTCSSLNEYARTFNLNRERGRTLLLDVANSKLYNVTTNVQPINWYKPYNSGWIRINSSLNMIHMYGGMKVTEKGTEVSIFRNYYFNWTAMDWINTGNDLINYTGTPITETITEVVSTTNTQTNTETSTVTNTDSTTETITEIITSTSVESETITSQVIQTLFETEIVTGSENNSFNPSWVIVGSFAIGIGIYKYPKKKTIEKMAKIKTCKLCGDNNVGSSLWCTQCGGKL